MAPRIYHNDAETRKYHKREHKSQNHETSKGSGIFRGEERDKQSHVGTPARKCYGERGLAMENGLVEALALSPVVPLNSTRTVLKRTEILEIGRERESASAVRGRAGVRGTLGAETGRAVNNDWAPTADVLTINLRQAARVDRSCNNTSYPVNAGHLEWSEKLYVGAPGCPAAPD